MKRIIKSALMRFMALILLTFGTASASAQYYLNIVQKNVEKVQYLVSNIVNVYYSGQGAPATSYEYVDLGLSVKWATCNVGATKPEEFGDYFAWGETEPKSDYSWDTYKWCKGSSTTMTKYCNNSEYGNNGFTDTKTTLDPEDDVAHVKWGGSWRMPTKAELDELRNNCTWTWYSRNNTEFNGVTGYKVTSNKEGYTDCFIFLPAAGSRLGTNPMGIIINGSYYSSTLYTHGPEYAYRFDLRADGVRWNQTLRVRGQSVRPVCP